MAKPVIKHPLNEREIGSYIFELDRSTKPWQPVNNYLQQGIKQEVKWSTDGLLEYLQQ
jgi:hypothetical protein